MVNIGQIGNQYTGEGVKGVNGNLFFHYYLPVNWEPDFLMGVLVFPVLSLLTNDHNVNWEPAINVEK